jgi:glycosyltransferase involved in cell wall biosynthesis
MHVLFSYPAYKPAYRMGGPVSVLASMAEGLVRMGHRATVVTTNANLDQDLDVPLGRPVDLEGVEVWYFGRDEFLKRWFPFIPYLSNSNGYFYSKGMSAALRRLVPEVDVVHVHSPFSYTNLAAARAAFLGGKPLIYQQHGILDPERLRFRSFKKRMYLFAVERPIMRRAAAVVALTQREEESYGALGVSTRCHRVVNGVAAAEFRSGPRRTGYAGWRVGPGSLLILFLGRLHPIKGPDRLLEAFLRIHERFPDAVLVLAGPDECGLAADLRMKAEEAGVSEKVFIPGMVTGEEKLDLLARADLFCLPSDAEGFSLAVLEALASGTGVLLSPGCHFPEVKAAGAGEIADVKAEALQAALVSLLSNPARLREMGERGRRLVERDYSWEHVTSRLLEIYESVSHRPS